MRCIAGKAREGPGQARPANYGGNQRSAAKRLPGLPACLARRDSTRASSLEDFQRKYLEAQSLEGESVRGTGQLTGCTTFANGGDQGVTDPSTLIRGEHHGHWGKPNRLI